MKKEIKTLFYSSLTCELEGTTDQIIAFLTKLKQDALTKGFKDLILKQEPRRYEDDGYEFNAYGVRPETPKEEAKRETEESKYAEEARTRRLQQFEALKKEFETQDPNGR